MLISVGWSKCCITTGGSRLELESGWMIDCLVGFVMVCANFCLLRAIKSAGISWCFIKYANSVGRVMKNNSACFNVDLNMRIINQRPNIKMHDFVNTQWQWCFLDSCSTLQQFWQWYIRGAEIRPPKICRGGGARISGPWKPPIAITKETWSDASYHGLYCAYEREYWPLSFSLPRKFCKKR